MYIFYSTYTTRPSRAPRQRLDQARAASAASLLLLPPPTARVSANLCKLDRYEVAEEVHTRCRLLCVERVGVIITPKR
ncbi:hypothetical protein PsYK624_129170 [Phanerochaete sordida]|uniref:Uncharacterized protein n=1 Tax=Phanerochaete sordida TaxID=48140 RepID=A0A9P3GKL7_9APHY|nr:hypothetical protein PsYK624_129170 [Phanerochaete sordida]